MNLSFPRFGLGRPILLGAYIGMNFALNWDKVYKEACALLILSGDR